MVSRYRVSIDSIQLDSIDESILILDIQYPDPGKTPTLETVGARDGALPTRFYRQKATVTVSFCVNKYNTRDRNEVLQKVITWAKSGMILRTSDRELQFLAPVIVETYPTMSVKNWTEPLTIVFGGYVFPFWQNENEVTLTLTAGTNQSGSITIPGNADKTHLTAAITAATSVTWIKIMTSLTTLYLTGLTLSNGQVVTIDYDGDMNLRIMQGTTSLLNKRTADSSDELLIPCGTSTVTVQASANVSSVIKGRGCWEW